MTPEIESLFRDVDQAKPDMRATWAYLVNHDSGSKNKAAVDALQAFAAHTLKNAVFRYVSMSMRKPGTCWLPNGGT